MPGYWTSDTGENLLKGVPGDPNNPVRCQDRFIIYALQMSQQARDEFFAILPSLLPEEQTRLNSIITLNPWPTSLVKDPQTIDDNFQRRLNTMSVGYRRR